MWRTATLVARDDWTAVDHVTSDDVAIGRAADEHHASSLSSALRDAWSRDATAEHASIAAFARFTLELLTVGAPATFVEDAQRAALDEIEHARLCFSLAGRHAAGEAIGPAALPLDGLTLRNELADVAAATVEEACCAETFAALVAVRALERCCDREAYAALDRIASDEMRHAELAWRFVAWALGVGDTRVRDAVVRAFERGLVRLADAPIQCSSDSRGDDAWRAAGRSTPGDLAEVTREAREILIRPCMERLLAT